MCYHTPTKVARFTANKRRKGMPRPTELRFLDFKGFLRGRWSKDLQGANPLLPIVLVVDTTEEPYLVVGAYAEATVWQSRTHVSCGTITRGMVHVTIQFTDPTGTNIDWIGIQDSGLLDFGVQTIIIATVSDYWRRWWEWIMTEQRQRFRPLTRT